MNFAEIENLEEQFQVATYAKMNIAVERGLARGFGRATAKNISIFTAVTRFARPDIRIRTLSKH